MLHLFIQLDARFLPVTENDAEEALDAYNAFVWDASKSWLENIGVIEDLVETMRESEVHDDFVPDNRQLYRRIRIRLLKLLPGIRVHFDYIERVGKPAHGTREITAHQWIISDDSAEYGNGDAV